MPIFEARYRLIIKQEIEAPNQEAAEKMAREFGKRQYLDTEVFVYVDLASVKEKGT